MSPSYMWVFFRKWTQFSRWLTNGIKLIELWNFAWICIWLCVASAYVLYKCHYYVMCGETYFDNVLHICGWYFRGTKYDTSRYFPDTFVQWKSTRMHVDYFLSCKNSTDPWRQALCLNTYCKERKWSLVYPSLAAHAMVKALTPNI